MHRRLIQVQQFLLRSQARVSALVRRAFTGRPRTLAATIVVLTVALLTAAGSVAWFAWDLTRGLPTRQELREMGDMVQSTTIFDAAETLARGMSNTPAAFMTSSS